LFLTVSSFLPVSGTMHPPPARTFGSSHVLLHLNEVSDAEIRLFVCGTEDALVVGKSDGIDDAFIFGHRDLSGNRIKLTAKTPGKQRKS
jgi:hypothetical protein